MQSKAKYLKIRNESAAERHAVKVASKATAPVAAPTSTLQAAMDVVAAAGGMYVVMAATQGAIWFKLRSVLVLFSKNTGHAL